MKTAEFLDNKNPAIFYKASCGCASDCGVTIILEYDEEINDITMSIYQKLVYCSWCGIDPCARFYWFRDVWHRIKGAIKLLYTGRIKIEEVFLFSDTDQIDAFISAIKEGREKIKAAKGN
jgi:hypothetical protein